MQLSFDGSSPGRTGVGAAGALLQPEADIGRLRGVGQGPGRNKVRTAVGVFANVLQVDAPRSLHLGLPGYLGACFPDFPRRKVIQQQVPRAGGKRLVQLRQAADFDFNRQGLGTRQLQRLADPPAAVM